MSERKFNPVRQFESNDPALRDNKKWVVSEAVSDKKGIRTVTTATSGEMHGAIDTDHLHIYERADGVYELKGDVSSRLMFTVLARTALRGLKGEAFMLAAPGTILPGMMSTKDESSDIARTKNLDTGEEGNEAIFYGDIHEIDYQTQEVLKEQGLRQVNNVPPPYEENLTIAYDRD